MRCWNTVRYRREGLVRLTRRGMGIILPLYPPFFDCRTNDFRPSPKEGDQAAGAGVASLAGPSRQYHRCVKGRSPRKSLVFVCVY